MRTSDADGLVYHIRPALILVLGSLVAIGVGAAVARLFITDAFAHSWFTTAVDPVLGVGCCSGTDCNDIPDTDVEAKGTGYVYKPTGEFIPRERVQSSASYGFARCEFHYDYTDKFGAMHPKGSTRCFFEPSGF